MGQPDMSEPDMEQPDMEPSDKPFDDKEPFDAGVEANEETDPKKFIEQLSGKIGQSLRKFTETQGQPDFELEKFAINSLLSATHTSEMDDNDKNDIIKKVNTAGNNDSKEPDMGDNNNNNDNGNDNEGGSNDNNDLSFDSNNEEGLEEYKVYESDDLFLDKPKKNNMFQPNSNDILDSTEPTIKETIKNLFNSKKNSMFDRKILMSKLQETFNQEIMSEPIVEPKTKPVTAPTVKPSRRNNPFTIEPDTMPQVPPKASDDSFNNIV